MCLIRCQPTQSSQWSAHISFLNITSGISQARNFQLLRMRCKDESEELLCCSIVATADGETFILENEGVEDIAYNMSIPNNRILQSGELVGRIRSCTSIASVTATFCDSVMEVIRGYDRGMVYRWGRCHGWDGVFKFQYITCCRRSFDEQSSGKGSKVARSDPVIDSASDPVDSSTCISTCVVISCQLNKLLHWD